VIITSQSGILRLDTVNLNLHATVLSLFCPFFVSQGIQGIVSQGILFVSQRIFT